MAASFQLNCGAKAVKGRALKTARLADFASNRAALIGPGEATRRGGADHNNRSQVTQNTRSRQKREDAIIHREAHRQKKTRDAMLEMKSHNQSTVIGS